MATPPSSQARTQILRLASRARWRCTAPEVEIRFTANDSGGTSVEIEHRGWERLGREAGQWRDQNRAGWQTLLPHFQAAIASTRKKSS